MTRRLSLFVVVLAMACRCATAQQAEVLIYTHGSWASDVHPYSRNGIFNGGIWDGDEPLFLFMDRLYKTNDRYLILTLPEGPHVFGTGEGRHPRASSKLPLTLKSGERYFIRVHAKWDLLGTQTDTLEVVNCQTAHDELAKGKALDIRAVQKDKRSLVSASQALPPCS